ncbi:hypothetical protein VTK73DRAFT_4325 [Phialemonium thermophilum]|uniref:NYN domain-containing protein n=1 Tax=Phialemonium thermophilum TaxID=223376 RepID=A0ABR3V9Q9_9PEZI
MGNGSLALLPDGNASSRGMSLASGGAPSILQATLYAPLAPVDSHAVYGLDDETRRSLDLETPCSPDRSPTRKNVGASPSFQPAFRYREYEAQPFDDVKLYRAVGPHTQYGMTPHYMCSEEDKQKIIVIKMAGLFQMDAQLERTMPVARKPVHIFVDLSNIVIGFYDSLRKIHGIPTAQKMKAPPFSFQNLAMVLERGRRVGKKVVAGSLVNTYNRRWPAYMEEAKGLGYEMNILQRVPKAALSPARNKPRRGTHNGDGGEWTTSGAESSGGEDAACFPLRNGEQGVDEILHLKMLQSALDSEPGTVVLATGDAAEAEYSDGFKKNVERLLQSGWNVEIIGWAQCISSAWKDPGFVEKWGDRVRLIELDMFTEELFAVWF